MPALGPRLCAFSLGLIGILLGALGFITAAAPNHLIFGLFQVTTFHNIVHIFIGVVGIIAAIPTYRRYAAWYVLEIGFVYGALTFFGFALNGDFFGLTYFNANDNLLHAGIAVVALIMAAFIAAGSPGQFIKMAEVVPEPVADSYLRRW